MQTTEQRSERLGIARLRELAAVVLMLVAISLLASCGGGEQGNGGGGQDGGSGGNGGGKGGGQAGKGGQSDEGIQGGDTGRNRPPITDMRVIISTQDTKSLNNVRARLRDAEVREVVSERAFYVGENDAERLLVLNVGEAAEVSEGQSVIVAGRLNTPRPELEKALSLSPEEASAVKDQRIFLRAPRVSPEEG